MSTIIMNRINDTIENYHMARVCGKYFTSNIFGVLAIVTDGQHQGFSTTNGIPKKQTPISRIEPVFLFYSPHQFICYLRGEE